MIRSIACLSLLVVLTAAGCVRLLGDDNPSVDDGSAEGVLGRLDAAAQDGLRHDGGQPEAWPHDLISADLQGPDLSSDTAPPPDATQPDLDQDGVPDTIDNCPKVKNPGQDDLDKDGVGDACDNCASEKNTGQDDLDKDGIGDACDEDKDGDKLPNGIDPDPVSKDTVYYYKHPGSTGAASDWETTGTWTSSAAKLCQQSADATLSITRLKSALVTQADYRAETRFDVSGLNTTALAFPYAGLTFRATSISGAFVDMYACAVDLKSLRLVLIKYYSGSGGGETVYGETLPGTVPTTGPYRLRVKAVGSSHTCQLMGSAGASLSLTNTYHTAGTVGFVTHGVKACFEYLWVLAP